MSSYCFKPQSWWYFCRRHHISFYSSLYYILFRSRISTWYFALVVPQLGDPLLANWILCCCQVKKRRLGVQEIHWQRCVEKWNIYIVTGQQQRSAPLCWLIMFHLSNACHWNWYSLNGVHLAGGYLEGHHIQRDPVSSWGGERDEFDVIDVQFEKRTRRKTWWKFAPGDIFQVLYTWRGLATSKTRGGRAMIWLPKSIGYSRNIYIQFSRTPFSLMPIMAGLLPHGQLSIVMNCF